MRAAVPVAPGSVTVLPGSRDMLNTVAPGHYGTGSVLVAPGHYGSGSVLVAPGHHGTGSVLVAHGFRCSTACVILPDLGLNSCLLHWQADSPPLNRQCPSYFK